MRIVFFTYIDLPRNKWTFDIELDNVTISNGNIFFDTKELCRGFIHKMMHSDFAITDKSTTV